ncbi:mucin-2-like isoform X2 [Ruditapes philippinarum]|nr:mucin-2-like isoform X2 [Ruditapes philippinarum]
MRSLWIVLLVSIMASCVSTFENMWLRQLNEGPYNGEFGYDEPCIECCETRDQGSVVVLADILEDCRFSTSTIFPSSTMGISSSSIFTSPRVSTPTSTTPGTATTPGCICCEFRKQGYVVVVAELIEEKCVPSTSIPTSPFPTSSTFVESSSTSASSSTALTSPDVMSKSTTTSPDCCCETRKQGRVIVVARVNKCSRRGKRT